MVTRLNSKAYWSGGLDRNLGHADIGSVEVLDGLGGIVGRLVADIANAALWYQLDVGDLSAFG